MGLLKIDPVDTIYGVGGSLVGRILSFFLSGWLGYLVGGIAISFDSFSDVLDVGEILMTRFSDFSAEDGIIFVFWPVAVLFYIVKIPLYGISLALIVLTAAIKIIYLDDPILFWMLLIITSISLGPVLSEGHHLVSCLALLFIWTGLFAGKWWAIQNFHPEWIDWFKQKVRPEDDYRE